MIAVTALPRTLSSLTSVITRLVELRESADTFNRSALAGDPNEKLTETRKLVDGMTKVLPLVDQLDSSMRSPGLVRAQSMALRELTAARRHQELAGKSEGTRHAACELALRCLVRAVDVLLPELVPHTIAPKA